MAHYQTTMQQSGTLLQGNALIKVAASAGTLVASGVNVGIGQFTGFTENITPFTVQAGNAADPIEGISEHTLTVTFDLLEFYLPTFDTLRGGNLDLQTNPSVGTYITGGSVQSFSTGGLTELTAIALMIHNTKIVSSATVETIFVGYKGTIDQGITFTPKSDNDEDPIAVFSWAVTFELDTGRTSGDQLYIVETEMAAASA